MEVVIMGVQAGARRGCERLAAEASSTAVLVERAQAGDRLAFERLVEPHLAAALGAATLITGQPSDGADAVQDALLIAWRQLPRLRAAELFAAWFRRIVVNSAIRIAGRHRRLVELDLSRAAPADHLDHQLDLRRLGRAMARLDARDRTILTIRHFWDMPVEEAARLLGVPEGTIKSRSHHALKRLRAAYDAEDRR